MLPMFLSLWPFKNTQGKINQIYAVKIFLLFAADVYKGTYIYIYILMCRTLVPRPYTLPHCVYAMLSRA